MNKEQRTRIRNVMQYLSKCWKRILIFELIYKLFSAVIFTPVVVFLFNLSIKITAHGYLTFENLIRYFLNPITIILLLIVIACMAFYSLFDISAIIYIYDQAYRGYKVPLLAVIKNALLHSLKVFQKKNILFSVYILFVIPFLNIGIASGYIGSISLPNVVIDFMAHHQFLKLLLILLVVFLCILVIRWIYSIHYFVLEDCSFREATKRSVAMIKQKFWRDGSVLILMEGVVALVFYLSSTLGISIITLICKHFLDETSVLSVSMLIIVIFVTIFSFLASALATPIFYGCISSMFYYHRGENNEELSAYEFLPVHFLHGKGIVVSERVQTIIVVLLMAVCCIYVYLGNTGKVNFNIEYVHTMEVSAHRGDSVNYPENTMSAFEGAVESGADWIELDVQQTSDGQIVVMHDSNLKRTTGVDKNIWDVTYEEIKDLDCGSWFDADYSDQRIPLLKDVIEFAKKNGVRLNIELKPTGHETNFEQQVVDLITSEHFANECVVTSQEYKSLQAVKEYDDKIVTVYVMSVAYGNITNLQYADAFSVESSFVTEKLVNKVHNEGKELFVWTVNSKSEIEKMINLNVDNIITDNTQKAHEIVYSNKNSSIILKYVDYLLSL